MILHIGVTQETMEITDPNNTMIPTDIVTFISKMIQDRLIASRDTNHEAQIDSEKTHAIVLTAYTDQVVFALEIDVPVRVMKIHALNHPYATCYVSDVVALNMHLQIENVLYHWNKSRRTYWATTSLHT